MIENTDQYKQKLEAEKAQLDEELKAVGIKDPNDPDNWIPKASDLDTDRADVNESADAHEDSLENRAILDQLEVRYKNIIRALKKIEDGAYGVDELDGEPIEEDRLNANPAARTRKANIERESELGV